MPVIKKKWKQSNLEDSSLKEDDIGIRNNEDENTELPDPDSVKGPSNKAVKRSVSLAPSMLKGLDGQVLLEKRKRFTPSAELKLSEWLDNNLEQRTEVTVHLPLLYNYYTELCQASTSEILDVPVFNRMVKKKFGKTFGVQASSIYKSVIKERKIGDKKKVGSGWKMKETVVEAINHFGNPWNGVRFATLKQYVGTRHPALQIDSKPKLLKRALEMGTRFGYVDLAKGIGMAGFYRLPGAVEAPPKPKASAKKVEGVDGEVKSDGEEGNESSEKETEAEKNGETEAEKDDGTVDDKADDGTEKEDTVAKPKKAKKIQSWSYSDISHSDPSRVEDTFPLAITYQSAPKAVSVPRIRRYISENYGEEVTDSRWRKTLENGVDKGLWEHISGSGITGRIHLLMDDFDPNSEHLEDRICAAIIACHDPKSASANQIKKYITQYHTDFKVDQRPDRFKKALQRAVDKKMIKQLSGLGANGSFLLVVPFTPSPTVLAGEDDSEEEMEDDEETVKQSYVPRGTKSRGMPKVKTMEIIKSKPPTKRAAPSSSSRGRGKKRPSNDAEEARKSKQTKSTSKKRSGNSSKSQGKQRKRSLARAPSPLTDEDEEENEVEYTPSKSSSRGGDRGSPTKPKSAQKGKNDKGRKVTKSPSKKTNRSSADDSEEEEDVDFEVEYTPRKSSSRGGEKPASRSAQKKSASKSDGEEELSENEDEDVLPSKSMPKGKSGKGKKKRGSKKGKR